MILNQASGTQGKGVGWQSPEMLLLFWQLVASNDFSPLTKIHQNRCVGPLVLFTHRRWVVAPTH